MQVAQAEDRLGPYCFLNYLLDAPNRMQDRLYLLHNRIDGMDSYCRQTKASQNNRHCVPGLLRHIRGDHAWQGYRHLHLVQLHPSTAYDFSDQQKCGKDFCRPLHKFRVLY